MRTIPHPIAYQRLTTNHETMRWISELGAVSVRKTHGKYVVRVEDYTYHKTFKQSYATLPGALVAAEGLREFYL